MSLKWNLRAHDAQLVQSIERASGVSPVIAQLLALRGITQPNHVSSFLDLKMTGLRKPSELPGIDAAVDAIFESIESKEKICVYGDYDADGMTSTAILYRCLKKLGAEISYFVPNRLDDGYGVSNDNLKKIQERGSKLVITVDCGITSVAEVEYAKTIGLRMVITDHHHVGMELPNAAAIVHPGLPHDPYPFPGLCGAGVAFKLAWALCQRRAGSEKLPESMRNFLFAAVSLAAIGTVCDVVPLLDENRIIVHHGLNCMTRYANRGLQALIKIADCDKKPKLESEDLGFRIGPRLNAAGRLGQAQLGVELLTCDSPERAQQLATYINELNKNRDSLDRRILKSANEVIKKHHDPENEPAIVLAQPDWHLGVIGIAAGRIAELYHRPTILISLDPLGARPGVGSCRSACGVNLYDAIQGSSQHLIKFGGHSAAAGLSIDPDKVDAFREDFCEQVIDQVSVDELIPDLDIDAEALLGHLTFQMMNDLEKLAPFGQKNPRPLMCATEVRLAEPPRTMGSDGRHLSLRLEQHGSSVRAVAFGKADWAKELEKPDACFDFAFRPQINEFRGHRSVQLHLVDFRPSGSDVDSKSGQTVATSAQ
jgi:single-stranded-DNA-specific exonuclease